MRQALTATAVLVVLLCSSRHATAEWYVAGQAGVNFADQLEDIGGTGPLVGLRAPDFDLQNSVAYGGKLGYYSRHGWIGFELDAFHSTPHIKNLDDVPGIHMRVTNVGFNFLVRYPGQTFQPYAGIGGAILIARLARSPTTVESDTDVAGGLNLLAGLRAFVTPYVAVFTEYKYTRSTFEFDNVFAGGGGFIGDYSAQLVMVGVSYHF